MKKTLHGVTVKHNYIPGTNKIYDDYLFRKSDNQFKRSIIADEERMEFYTKMYNKTNDEYYLRLYNLTKKQYDSTVKYYNTNYPKRDDVVIYIQSRLVLSRTNSKSHSIKDTIYPEDWE